MKNFEIPAQYKSTIISELKQKRKSEDKLKRDFSPTLLDFGAVKFYIARHFGFCYGVENAIETIYKTIAENKNNRIFLLSEMIHNAKVNQDLQELGVQFLMDTLGNKIINFDTLTTQDIVVIPAFGTTLELEQQFSMRGIELKTYDTTCPFVEKVWKRSEKLGSEQFTVLIHGKPSHEETRATFSHTQASAKAIVIKDLKEAKILADYILAKRPLHDFFETFASRTSEGFDPKEDLKKIGVVNQTTMLATDTQEIADYIKYTLDQLDALHQFADTRDTLCYATSDNQKAVYGMLKQEADFALVIGGFNSSNTSHLVELCHQKLPTFHIDDAQRILSKTAIEHLDFDSQLLTKSDFLRDKQELKILITSGASCPDSIVDQILIKILSYFSNVRSVAEVMEKL